MEQQKRDTIDENGICYDILDLGKQLQPMVRFAYFDAVQDALIAGYEQNQEFYAILLYNDEKKRELMQAFLEDLYKHLRSD